MIKILINTKLVLKLKDFNPILLIIVRIKLFFESKSIIFRFNIFIYI